MRRRFGLVLSIVGLLGFACLAPCILERPSEHERIVLSPPPTIDALKIDVREPVQVRAFAERHHPSLLPKLSASQRAPAASRIWEFESG